MCEPCMVIIRAALESATERLSTVVNICQAELGGPFNEITGEGGPSWSALMDHDFPLNLTGAYAHYAADSSGHADTLPKS
jgi:hypothetical protein